MKVGTNRRFQIYLNGIEGHTLSGWLHANGVALVGGPLCSSPMPKVITMNRTLLVAALLALALPSMGQANDADVEKDVARLSEQITGAIVKGDTTFLDSVMADDWMVISPDGSTEDKAKHLKDIKDGTVKYDAMDKSDTKVRVFGDTAVVTGRNQARLRIRGHAVTGNVRFTEVFARRGKTWQVVSVQLTPIAAPAGDQP